MKTVQVTIQGVSPLLIHRFQETAEVAPKMKKAGKKDYGTPREQAEQAAYKDDDGRIWIPSSWVKGAIQTVASDYKLPSSRKSVKSVSGGAIIPVDEKVYFEERYSISDIEIDSRPVVVQRARVMRHRARIEKWTLALAFEVDDEILDLENVHQILSDSGRRSGIGDFRPQKGGPFGRFMVTKWDVLKDAADLKMVGS